MVEGPAGTTRARDSRVTRVVRAYHRAITHRLYASRRQERDIVDGFHRYYHDLEAIGGTLADTFWLGVKVLKLPLDLWIYQELLWSLRPDLIVETGTLRGGSALYLASVCDLLDHGRVVTIDIEDDESRPTHPRITYVHGSSTDPAILDRVRQDAAGAATVMVILDSDHSRDHVLAELRAYAALVTPGSYLIVEDTHVNGNPILPEHGPGPKEAVEQFLRDTDAFTVDDHCEKFLMSFNRGGYLRKTG
jgi:cephalosporin hydroxylase